MNTLKPLKLAGMVSVLAVLPVALALAVHAETTAPAAPPSKSAPAVTPAQPSAQKAAPDAGAARSKSTDAPVAPGAAGSIANVTIGTAVYSADGQQVGEVKGVKSEASGAINEIHVKTSSLVGLGGKIVVVPASKIAKGGQTIQLALKTGEVGKLPILVDGHSG